MKTLKEQIESKCVHFNGIMNNCCKVGVNYADVRVDKPYKFPCLKQGGECSKSQFPTTEEINSRIEEIEGSGLKAIMAHAAIKSHFNETNESTGSIKCECGGNLNYNVAPTNGHIWAKCSKCSLSFME